MFGIEVLRDLPCILRFVKRVFFEADRESLYTFASMPRSKCRDCRGVDPSGKQDAERNIRHEPHPDGVGKEFAEPFSGGGCKVRTACVSGRPVRRITVNELARR
jgi:hypothetical protein